MLGQADHMLVEVCINGPTVLGIIAYPEDRVMIRQKIATCMVITRSELVHLIGLESTCVDDAWHGSFDTASIIVS